jgi:DNA polymerase III sliding clamp (beta) subunit (PCNA family)
MTKIKLSDLKDFLRKSSKIKTNGVIPVHEFLLIETFAEEITITKTNGNAFIKTTITQDNEAVEKHLIEEKRLSAFASNAKGEFITVRQVKQTTILKDGENEVKLGAVDGVNFEAFQRFPETEGAETTVLGPDLLAALFAAKDFVSILESNLHFVYVQPDGNGSVVFATNQHLLYERKFEEVLPEMTLSPDVCSIVSTFNHVSFFTAGNYNFFDTGSTVYGFIKTEYKAPNYKVVINQISFEDELKMDREEVLSFCQLVNSLSVEKFATIKFDDIEEAMLIHWDESGYSTETERKLDVEKNFPPKPFALNCIYLMQILKCFDTKEVSFYPGDNERIYAITHPDEPGLKILICPLMYK